VQCTALFVQCGYIQTSNGGFGLVCCVMAIPEGWVYHHKTHGSPFVFDKTSWCSTSLTYCLTG